MSLRRSLATLALLGLMAGCGRTANEDGNSPGSDSSLTNTAAPTQSSSPSPSPSLNETFRNGAFEVTVTDVELGSQLIDVDDTAKSGGIKGFTPENGQFIIVHLTAKNVGDEPETFYGDASTLTDSRGKKFSASGPYLFGALNQGLYDEQQPDTTRKGWIAFDVPTSVTDIDYVSIQSDSELGTTNPPTQVQIATVSTPAATPANTPGAGTKAASGKWSERVKEITDAFFAANPDYTRGKGCETKTHETESVAVCTVSGVPVVIWAGARNPDEAIVELNKEFDNSLTMCRGKDFLIGTEHPQIVVDLVESANLGCLFA